MPSVLGCRLAKPSPPPPLPLGNMRHCAPAVRVGKAGRCRVAVNRKKGNGIWWAAAWLCCEGHLDASAQTLGPVKL